MTNIYHKAPKKNFIHTIREALIGFGFKLSSRLYILLKTGPAWNIRVGQLLSYPTDSLGFSLGCFLAQHEFEPQAHCESHDIFHILTGYSTNTAQEIAMQYWLWGNGKRSIYSALAMFVGIIFYPDHYGLFISSYRQGTWHIAIHNIDYKNKLSLPISSFKIKLKS